MKSQGVGFQAQSVETIGKKIANSISEALYCIDPHHETMKTRGTIPEMFQDFEQAGFVDWKRHKHKKPQVCVFCLRIKSVKSYILKKNNTLKYE